MKKNIVGFFTLCLFLTGCSGHGNDGHDESAPDDGHLASDEIVFTPQQAEAAGLTTMQVAPEAFGAVIKTSGQILSAPGDEVRIVATTSGTVALANPSMTEGSAVRAGEALVTISAHNLLDGDPLAKAKIACEAAESNYRRAQELVKDRIISVKEFEQARMQYETSRAAYDTQAAGYSPKGMRVGSPVGGYLKEWLVGQGEYVSVGQPVATVVQNRRLQLRAEVSEQYFSALKSVGSANFQTAYDNTVYKLTDLNGRLLSFGKASGGASFYIPVTFEFDNTGDIIPGSFVSVYLLSTVQDNVLSVPVSAITEEQGLYFVYLQLDEEGYRKQEVTLGQSDGARVQIMSGLTAGDVVVTQGVYQVKLAALAPAMPEGHTH
ncbi:MAG: efflux RND transporter periplasmic adaptor subunit [Prevotellaceae bacterium]|jgi:RND family efflux transporter MFP subunit|nr:efflux RND transporter periplasmic adaptor subunit [Prevotellaceae bacterium]